MSNMPTDNLLASILARLDKLESDAARFEEHRQSWIKLCAGLTEMKHTGDTRRVIVTKRHTYELEPDAVGVPLQDRYPGAKLPDRLKDARIYQTPDGPVIATA